MLYILENCLLRIEDGFLDGLFEMLGLSLQNNFIQYIGDYAFQPKRDCTNCSRIRFIKLFSNRITHITDKHFIGLPNLNWLDLSGNRIEMIENNAFANLHPLENCRILLAYNKVGKYSSPSIIMVEKN